MMLLSSGLWCSWPWSTAFTQPGVPTPWATVVSVWFLQVPMAGLWVFDPWVLVGLMAPSRCHFSRCSWRFPECGSCGSEPARCSVLLWVVGWEGLLGQSIDRSLRGAFGEPTKSRTKRKRSSFEGWGESGSVPLASVLIASCLLPLGARRHCEFGEMARWPLGLPSPVSACHILPGVVMIACLPADCWI